jgi:hypothetical protein
MRSASSNGIAAPGGLFTPPSPTPAASLLEAAVPRHRQQVRRLVLDRLIAQQIDQLADTSRTILDGLHRS